MTTDLAAQLGEMDAAWLDEMNKAMQDSGGVQLPFSALNIWAHNGKKAMAPLKSDSPVSYFGGWHIDQAKFDEMCESGDITLSPGWKLVEMQGEQDAYTVYETRIIHVAPISYRLSWLSKDGRSRTPKYDDAHSRSHIQYLCLIGAADEGQMKYLCPGVISVKGKGQTEAIKSAFAVWRKAIDANRKEMNAQRLPLFSWWMTLGTSGDQPEFVSIGSGSQTSPITPIKAVMRVDKPDAAYISKRFIGAQNFATATQLFREAHDWLNAWKESASNDFTPAAPMEEELY